MKFILAKKVGMTTIFNEDGTAQNVSVLEAGKNVINQIRTKEKDGYIGIQFGLLKNKSNNLEIKDKSLGEKFFDKLAEMRATAEEAKKYKLGDEVKIDQFSEGEKVKVVGISKGKGFQGVMKRHNFKGAPATHGHKHDHRKPGSIGCAFPEHVLKGKKMAGRMGGERVSVKNLKIIKVYPEKSILMVKGTVPGNNGTIARVISLSE